MKQSDFGPAIAFFEQATENGDRSRALQQALSDSRFFYVMQTGAAALNGNNLPVAEQEFRDALAKRPDDPEALNGLGGTLLKAQQNDQAAEVFSLYVRVAPGAPEAWRGLLMARYGAGRFGEALATDRRVPARVKASLASDPDYLRTLASTYMALGREADARRVLAEALNLPFPTGGAGVKVEVQLQYAALLSTAGRKEQAIGLYRQVLTAEPRNVNAWVGLVLNEHQLGQDAEAYGAIRSMPPEVYTAAMQEAGFESSAAGVYEALNHDDLAANVLEQMLAGERAEGKQLFAPAVVQLAGLYVKLGQPARAYPLYRTLLETNPGNVEAWAGLLSALHVSGRDADAMAQLQAIPPATRRELESSLSYLQTVGSIYASLGDSPVALQFFARVEQHYAEARIQPPAELEVQQAWLLYNAGSDQALLRLLLQLGGRTDLSDAQRRTLQTVWTNLAVRRANHASSGGNYHLALAILNAAAQSFPQNREVLRALAGGYAAAGQPKEAVAIFRGLDMNTAAAGDYRSAVGAALAAHDLRDAETWLRFGLEKYPRDPEMLVLAAKFETQRGDPRRAAEYYRAALAALPPASPGEKLAAELSKAAPAPLAGMPARTERQSLATLLALPDPYEADPRRPAQPYLPSYTNASGTNLPSGSYTPEPPLPPAGTYKGVNPAAPGGDGYFPGTPPGSAAPPAPGGASMPRLKDYQPRSSVQHLNKPVLREPESLTRGELHLHADKSVEQKFGPYLAFDPAAGVLRFVGVRAGLGDGVMMRPGTEVTAALKGAVIRVQGSGNAWLHLVRFQQPQSTGPAPSLPPQPNPAKQETLNGVQVVQVPYQQVAPQSTSGPKPLQPATSVRSMDTRHRAEAIHANQTVAAEPLSGVHRAPAGGTAAAGGKPPQKNSTRREDAPERQPHTPGSTGEQQYPRPVGRSGVADRHPLRQKPLPESAAGEADQAPPPLPDTDLQTQTPPHPQAPPLQYPVPGETPAAGQVPLLSGGFDAQQSTSTTLRGYYDPRPEPQHGMSARETAELGLAQIEGGYSGWLGGTAIGRYRSGTAGLDQLTALKVPFEASYVISDRFRLSIVPQAVFLNSGQLSTVSGALGAGPVLGTYLGSAPGNPVQQSASGIGFEAQMTTGTAGVAIGATPFEFLVSNLIGRGRWRPGNGHFTLFGGRDAVEETQLSYAGMRDPGTATPVYGGNVWGGVVQTGGGLRLDFGDEHSGLYAQGEGAVLTGNHVLQNQKIDGLLGAYFGVKNWPEAGSLNIGGLFYGMHFTYNERGETYGLGGYFSPDTYFLAAVPINFQGHYGRDLHYTINGSLGVQTFQEDNETYFPLDPGLLAIAGCTSAQLTTQTCGLPVNSSTGVNFSFDSEVSYHATDHWFFGGFLSANNTNNYDTVSGGFFARYTFRPQAGAGDYTTGLFPVQGLRPMRVP